MAEMDPYEAANKEAQYRHDIAAKIVSILVLEMVNESRGIDAHEGDEGAEVETLRANLVCSSAQPIRKKLQQRGSGECECSHSHDVVARNAALRFNGAKKRLGKRIASSHSVEQPPCGQLRPHP